MPALHQNGLVDTAKDIVAQTSELSKQLLQRSIVPPSGLAVGARSQLWTTHDAKIGSLRSSITALTQHLDKLLIGPHGFLHDYVSTNWEYGALYTLLEFDVLEKMPLDGSSVYADQLAKQSGLPPEKLLRICRLVATTGVLQEKEEGFFAHTAISETLVKDEGYKSFIRFQLFETRIASSHLADSLRKPNPFWTGQAAFDYAWGMPMYDWHAKHPDKGIRFIQAMESVSQNLDPGNGMIIDWLENHPETSQDGKIPLIIEVSGKTGSFSRQLANLFPYLRFEVQDSSPELLQHGEQCLQPEIVNRVRFTPRDLFATRSIQETEVNGDGDKTPIIYLLRGVLWSLEDSEAIRLMQSFIPALRHPSRPLLVISDLVSPAWGTFEPHVEKAFRRRDMTLMTMHNAKQRTANEWDTLIRSASLDFEVTYSEQYTSHSCRGLWQVQWGNAKITTGDA